MKPWQLTDAIGRAREREKALASASKTLPQCSLCREWKPWYAKAPSPYLKNPDVFGALSCMDPNHNSLDDKVLTRAWLAVLVIGVVCIMLIALRLALISL